METLPENTYLRKTIETLFTHKAEDIVIIDLQKFKTLLDDYLIICTSESEVQMRAILRKCEKILKNEGLKQLKTEYSPGVKWGILKSGEFILHVFENETRAYYSLERLWGDATIIKPDPSMIEKPEDNALEPDKPAPKEDRHEYL